MRCQTRHALRGVLKNFVVPRVSKAEGGTMEFACCAVLPCFAGQRTIHRVRLTVQRDRLIVCAVLTLRCFCCALRGVDSRKISHIPSQVAIDKIAGGLQCSAFYHLKAWPKQCGDGARTGA